MQRTTIPFGSALAAVFVLGAGCNQSTRTTAETTAPTTTKVEAAPDDSVISLSGTIVEAGPESFELDYGPGYVTVEMDDTDWFPEGEMLLEDDKVIVWGRVDDDLYDRRTIEAGSVYVKGLGTQFFANSADEEDFAVLSVDYNIGEPEVELTGTVARIDGKQFELKTGAGVIDVDTKLLPYDPLDDEGYQQIDTGDRVRVSGHLEPAFFENQDLAATMIVTLQSGPQGD